MTDDARELWNDAAAIAMVQTEGDRDERAVWAAKFADAQLEAALLLRSLIRSRAVTPRRRTGWRA